MAGAGPSGLVAAKTLLHDAPLGTFQVHVFDTQPRIGGLWPAAKADTEGLVHPLMVANQSKHTVQFSDLAWEPGSPELPRAWQIGRYLERYQKTYCQRARLRLETTVVSAQPIPTAGGTPDVKWRVHSRGARGEEQREDFEYLLVASGYAGKPAVEPSLAHQAKVPVIHSSRYRDLRSLLDAAASNGGTILVVGGQMSGVEIAGTIATHLSSAIHAPAPAPIANAAKYSIHHISHRPVWVIPLHTSPKARTRSPFSLRFRVADSPSSQPRRNLPFYLWIYPCTILGTESIS
jgi:cation diffusion facilitator CzcD-associated flavoprotein CzcO